MLRAVKHNVKDIVMFATDGIVSLKPLAVECPKEKLLGAWEHKQHLGGKFVQSGIYLIETSDPKKPEIKKTRGIRPAFINEQGLSISEWFDQKIFAAIERGEKEYVYPYKNFLTLGARNYRSWRGIGSERNARST